MDRRDFLAAAAITLNTPPLAAGVALEANPSVIEELTLADIGAAFAAGTLTSRRLTELYLARIDALDRRGPSLRAVIELSPQALTTAAELDRERSASGARGPLHGVPVLIKDNIETSDRLMTTAGSLALDGWYAPADAPLVARLRAAGAVILGKTNLSEWANFRSTHAVSGWSGRGGQTRNPYALNRSPSGSSSGSAVAVSANLCAVAIGTETDGSIVSPASINGIVGLKPTVGLIDGRGIVPLSHSQDTAGPLTRTVRDAAVLLTILARAPDADKSTDYARFVDPQGLRGARLGIARRFFADNAPLDRHLDHCIDLLKRAGAIIVDPASFPAPTEAGGAETDVLLYEFKSDLNAYLARLPADFRVRSLAELIRFNEAQAATEMPLFDQELLRQAEAKGGLDEAAYRDARAACLAASRGGIDAALAHDRLDALVTLTAGTAWLIDPVNGDADSGGCSSPAAVAGYPHITVPAGLHRGLPVGLSFFSAAHSEPTLLRLAAGFEQIAGGRPRPHFLGSLP